MNSVADLVGTFIVLDEAAFDFAQIMNMRQTGWDQFRGPSWICLLLVTV